MSANPFALSNVTSTACCVCGVWFSSPILAERLEDKGSFYCPNGHSQHYSGESKDAIIKRLENTIKQKDTAIWSERARADGLVNRVKGGKCPCCDKTYVWLAKHMEKKHPHFK